MFINRRFWLGGMTDIEPESYFYKDNYTKIIGTLLLIEIVFCYIIVLFLSALKIVEMPLKMQACTK